MEDINEKENVNNDKIFNNNKKSNVDFKKKIFLKISDVDIEDAMWWKKFCDRHFDGKQFTGIKYIRAVLEITEPIMTNFMNSINNHEQRLIKLEKKNESGNIKFKIPVTQGGNLKDDEK